PGAVRRADRLVPGGPASPRRLLHRPGGDALGDVARGVAPRRAPARDTRDPGREVLGSGGRRAHHRGRTASPRRHRRGRRLPHPSLLPRGKGARARARRRDAAARPPRPRSGAHAAAGLAGADTMRTLALKDVSVGTALPELPIAITTTMIVAGALASRDFTPLHHDKAAAQAGGMQDVFMN